jgi:hypothetical protein
MADIEAGIYTVREIFQIAGFNFEEKAAADHLNGAPDYRKVKVGGLGFDDLDKVLRVPEAADELVIAVDGVEDTKLTVVVP